VLNDGKEHATHEGTYISSKATSVFGIGEGEYNTDRKLSDGNSGSFSRYFDLDKWFEKTVENLPENVKKTFPFLICPKASKSERNKGCEGLPNRKVEALHGNMDGTLNKRTNSNPSIGKNFHATVKPIKLMSYLVTLGSREGDVILDPFVGSGTTCIVAQALNRKWLGIEISGEYCKIASARLGGAEVVELEGVALPSKSIPTERKIERGDCGYAGACSYRNENGNCLFKHPCKDKRTHCVHYILGE